MCGFFFFKKKYCCLLYFFLPHDDFLMLFLQTYCVILRLRSIPALRQYKNNSNEKKIRRILTLRFHQLPVKTSFVFPRHLGEVTAKIKLTNC